MEETCHTRFNESLYAHDEYKEALVEMDEAYHPALGDVRYLADGASTEPKLVTGKRASEICKPTA